jgi:glycosyltransferase involved in cell wall biosynthesis
MVQVVDTRPLVSVLMPVYNAEKHLKEAIDSILSQSYTHFEFLIINDGSTDSSEGIIQSYADERIRLIVNAGNKGLIYSLNHGISQCRGKYIVRMDADDISLPQRIEEQVTFMEQHADVGVCGCNYTQFTTSSETSYKAASNHDEILSYMIFNSSVVHPSLILRRSVLLTLDPVFSVGYQHSEDYELWSKLIAINKFSAVNKWLFRYRIHESQVTKTHNTQQLVSANKVRKELLDKLDFSYTEKELGLLSQMAAHQLFDHKKEIELLELFFEKLIAQNELSKKIDPVVFKQVMAYKWYTVCGYTTLGLWAFRKYIKSSLKLYNPQSSAKLLAKCLIRKVNKKA